MMRRKKLINIRRLLRPKMVGATNRILANQYASTHKPNIDYSSYHELLKDAIIRDRKIQREDNKRWSKGLRGMLRVLVSYKAYRRLILRGPTRKEYLDALAYLQRCQLLEELKRKNLIGKGRDLNELEELKQYKRVLQSIVSKYEKKREK